MELFDTNQYTTGTAYDFELNSSEKKQGKQPIYDPAWEDGSAFPGIEDEAEKWKEGDCPGGTAEGNRFVNPGGRGGVIQKAFRKKYRILWDNGHTADYTSETIKAYGYQRIKTDSTGGGDTSCQDSSIEVDTFYQDSSAKTDTFYRDSSTEVSSSEEIGDRWNPDHFDSNPSFKADGRQLTIFLEETGTGEPPEPDDFKSIGLRLEKLS